MLSKIHIPASKSISNRLLILQYLYPNISIDNLSTAKDTEVLKNSFIKINKTEKNIYLNIGHAGTAMRFLASLLSIIPNKTFILDGSERMQERPIKILVESLKLLGADIQYVKNEGFPPLKIKGKELIGGKIAINSEISSQYISALLLIAPRLSEGLEIELLSETVSKPYIEMTLKLLQKIGVKFTFNKNSIRVNPLKSIQKISFDIESDWSSASYFYGLVAIEYIDKLQLTNFKMNSLQGDSELINIFKSFGVKTKFIDDNSIEIYKEKDFVKPEFLEFDLINTPDLAQTITLTCLSLHIDCQLIGLQTLAIKETDRLMALKTEIEKLGAKVKVTSKSLSLFVNTNFNKKISIKTYNDHRMAMAFAILQKVHPIDILDKNVVIKSFPDFWNKFDL